MRRPVLSSFLFAAILGLCCMGVVTSTKADDHCEDPSDPRYDAAVCEETTIKGAASKTSSLAKIKSKCAKLGFRKGTESHGNCIKNLYKFTYADEIKFNTNISCKFKNLRIFSDFSGTPKLSGRIVGDGHLFIELYYEKADDFWIFKTISGPKSATKDQNDMLEMLFMKKSRSDGYFDIVYKNSDIRPFHFFEHVTKNNGEIDFDFKLDNGMHVKFLASRDANFSIKRDPKFLFSATGTCYEAS